MSNVDKRVVEMQFDNKQFEKDMATTVKSLKNFEKSLEFKDGGKGLEGFEKRLKNVEKQANNIDFNKLYNSVEQIKNRFSLLGMVAFSTVQKLTQDTINKVTGGLNQIYDTIMVKGQQRALNLEQANFKLMGLLKNEKEVAKVMEDVDYAVSGTAYGLDAAAGVAAQLAASQIKAGDEMKTALRGISGVAAMTSSSYEDIGQVFTRVAGQGKVMATDLNSLAARGLNAAATLADFLGVTEADIREMTRTGAIDFKTFATAMNEAFGEQSKKANETFTGAMQNVQAALARVGAGFKQPYIKYMRPVLVQLIDNINSVKDAFGPLYDTTSFLFEKISHFIITVLEPLVNVRKEGEKQIKTIGFLRDIFKNLQELITNNWERIARLINTATHLFWKFIDTLKPIASILTFLLKDLFGELMGLSWSLKDTYKKGNFLYKVLDSIKDVLVIVYHWFVTSWPNIKKILSSVFTIIKSIFDLVIKIVKPIKDALFDVLSFDEVTRILADIVSAISGVFKAIIDAFNESSESGDALREVLSFIFSILKFGITIIGKVVSLLAKGIRFLTPYIKILTSIAVKIGDILFHLLKLGFGKAAKGVQILIDKFKSMEGPLGAVREWFINAKTWLVDKFTSYTTAASNGLDWLKAQLTGSKKEFDSTGDSAEKSGNKISEFKERVKETTSSMVESIKSNQVVQTVWEKVKTFFSYIWTGIKNLVNQVKTNFSKAFEGVTQRGVTPTVFDWIRGAFKSIGQLASDLIENLGPVKDALLKLTGTNSLMDLIQRIVSVFLSFQMGKFFKSFASFHDALANLPNAIANFVNAIRKPFDEINKNFKKRPSSALKNFAASMLMLAASLFIISKIPYKRLDKSLNVLLDLVILMVGAVVGVNVLLKDVNNAYKSIMAFALVIFAFQKVIRNIMLSFAALMLVVDKVEPATVWRSLAVVGVITTLIGAFTILFAKFAKMRTSATQLLAYSLLIKAIGSVIKEIALMIAILSLPIFDPGRIAVASGCIAGITIIIGALLTLFISKGSKFGNAPRQIMAFALLIKSFGSAIKGIAEMIAILSLPIFNPGRLWNSVAIISVIGILISGLLATMKLVQNNRASQIAAFALFVKAISSSLKGIMVLIGILSLLNPGRVWSCVGVIAAISAIIAGLTALSSKVGGDGLYKVGKGIMFIGVGILALATAIKTFSKLTPQAIIRVTDVITALVTKAPEWLGIIIAGLIQVINNLAPTIAESFINLFVTVIEIMTKSASTIVTALMNFFKVLVKEISSFSNAFDIKDLFWAINAVALIAGLIYILQVISSDMKSALKGIALMALVLGAIVGALVILNQFTNVDKTIDLVKGLSMALLSLAGVFAIIGIVTTIMNKIAGPKGTIEALLIGIVGFMLFIIATVAVFGAIGAVINLIGNDALEAINKAIEVMGLVGTALGTFMGSIVSSFASLVKDSDTSIPMLLTLVPLILALEPLTLVLPILTAFIIAIGALMNALDENFDGAGTAFLQKAVEILPLIGEALGGFLGSLVGAAAKFAAKGLAESILTFGKILSGFFDELQPFLDGLNSISGKTLEQAGQLTLILLEMCGVELVSAIANFLSVFTGGSSMVKLAEDLAKMGPYLVEFSKSLTEGKFNATLANRAAICTLIMVKALSSLPKDGGLKVLFTGNRISMEKLGEEAAGLGDALVKFADSVKGLTPQQSDKVKLLLPLIKDLIDIANAMPKKGGLWQKLIGELVDMKEFGENLASFGPDIVKFVNSLQGVTKKQLEVVDLVLPYVKTLIEVAESMPKKGGVWQDLIGELVSMGEFGRSLSHFATHFKEFSDTISVITPKDTEKINNIIPIIKSLVNCAVVLGQIKDGGTWQDISGYPVSMGAFAKNLIAFSEDFKSSAEKIGEISDEDIEKFKKLKPVIDALVSNATDLNQIKTGSVFGWLTGEGVKLDGLGSQLKKLGDGLTEFAASTSKISVGNVATAKNAADILGNLVPLIQQLQTYKANFFWFTVESEIDLDKFEDLGKIGTGLTEFAKNTAGIGEVKNIKTIGEVVKDFVDAIVSMKDVDKGKTNDFIECITKLNEKTEEIRKFSNIFGDNNSSAQNAYLRMQTIGLAIEALGSAFASAKDVSVPEGFFTSLYNLAYGIENENAHETADLLKVSYLLGNSNQNAQYAYYRILTLKAAIDVLSTAFNNANDGSYGDFKDKFLPALRDLAQSNLSGIVNVFGQNANLEDVKSKTAIISGILEDFIDAFQKIDSDKVTQVEDFTEAVGDLANTLTQDLATSIATNTPKVITAIENMIKSINDKIKAKDPRIGESAKVLMTNLSKAFNDHSYIAVNGFVSVLTKCINSAKTYNTVSKDGKIYTFYNAGSDAIVGYVEGISKNLYKAVEAGKKIGESALQGTRLSLDEHSPSKEYGKVAYNAVEGFILMMRNRIEIVKKIGSLLGQASLDGTESSLSKSARTLAFELASILDQEMEKINSPVITPVLDMSEIDKQKRQYVGLKEQYVGLNETSGYSAKIASFTASLINKNNANRANSKNNQNRSPDVVNAVNNLTSRMDSLENTIVNRPIVMDGEKVTKQIAPNIDRVLGKRKYYSGRGN